MSAEGTGEGEEAPLGWDAAATSPRYQGRGARSGIAGARPGLSPGSSKPSHREALRQQARADQFGRRRYLSVPPLLDNVPLKPWGAAVPRLCRTGEKRRGTERRSPPTRFRRRMPLRFAELLSVAPSRERRAALKILCPRGRVGSSPTPGTGRTHRNAGPTRDRTDRPMMTRALRAAFVALLLTSVSPWSDAPLAAQEPVIEEQVALDQAGRLLAIDAELARTLGVFGDLADVREILLFRSSEGYVLEVTRRRGGVLIRERRRLTDAEVARLRADVSGALAQRAPSALVDRSGRYILLATSTAAGLGFYGWAVPYALDVDDTRGQVGLYMLVSAASFFGPWIWSADRPVTLGMANGAFWGASRGIVHGIGAHRIVAGAQPGFASDECLPDDFR